MKLSINDNLSTATLTVLQSGKHLFKFDAFASIDLFFALCCDKGQSYDDCDFSIKELTQMGATYSSLFMEEVREADYVVGECVRLNRHHFANERFADATTYGHSALYVDVTRNRWFGGWHAE